MLVTEATIAGAEKPISPFETPTFAPIDVRPIAPALMSENEIAWLDTYHARVAEKLMPLVEAETRPWLGAATRPLRA